MYSRRAPGFAACIAGLALAFGAAAISASAQDARKELEALIQKTIENRHPPDQEADWWRSLGPEAPGVIMRMYRETDRIYFRMRLLQALAWYDDPEAVEFLKSEARGTDDEMIRNAAVKTVGHSQGEEALPFLQEFLKHADPDTRMAAASAVQRIAGESVRAKEVLQEYRRGEKTSWIVGKLDRQQEARERAQLKVQPGPGTVEPLLEAVPGTWKGQWLEPEPKKDGLKAMDAETALAREGGGIGGALVLSKAKKKREFRLEIQQMKGATLQGVLTSVPPAGAKPPPQKPPERFSFTGEWKRREGHSLLTLEIPRLAATLVLRKK